MATPRSAVYNRDDRDLLVELRTEMKAVRDDIQSLKDGVALRLSNLEQNAVSKIQFDDHETRIRKIERYQLLQMGAVGIVAAFITQVINLLGGTFHI